MPKQEQLFLNANVGGAAGRSVNEAQAVEKKARRQRAQNQIFGARLNGRVAVLKIRGHDVGGNRQRLKRNKKDQEIIGGGQKYRTDEAE